MIKVMMLLCVCVCFYKHGLVIRKEAIVFSILGVTACSAYLGLPGTLSISDLLGFPWSHEGKSQLSTICCHGFHPQYQIAITNVVHYSTGGKMFLIYRRGKEECSSYSLLPSRSGRSKDTLFY